MTSYVLACVQKIWNSKGKGAKYYIFYVQKSNIQRVYCNILHHTSLSLFVDIYSTGNTNVCFFAKMWRMVLPKNCIKCTKASQRVQKLKITI